jgi:uncharacterized protein YfkK (UPF0435 family)
MVLDNRNSNCKTNITIPVTITEANLSEYRFRFFIDNGKLCLMEEFLPGFSDEENIAAIKRKLPIDNVTIVNSKNLVNKTVNMRTMLYCQSKKICNVCAGDMFYRLHVTNVGLLANLISGALMNYSMKSFHNPTVKAKKFNVSDYIQ